MTAINSHLGAVRHDDFLDGLRGIAILLVVIAHATYNRVDLLGRSGVYLFFVLSAFLLTRQLCRAGLSARVLARYFIARVFRIYPLFILVLAYEVLIGYNLSTQMSLETAWRHLTLREGAYVYWTIIVEFQYYFVLPILVAIYLLVGTRRWPVSLLVALALVVLDVMGFGRAMIPPAIGDHVYLYLPPFLFGTIAGAWAARDEKASVSGAAGGLALVALVCALPDVARPIWSQLSPHPLELDDFTRIYVLQGLLWTIVLLAGRSGMWRRLLENSVLRFFGQISFSLYLMHFLSWVPCCARLEEPFARWFGLASTALIASLYVGVSVALAYISHRLVEKPMMRIGKRLALRLSGAEGETGKAGSRHYARAID